MLKRNANPIKRNMGASFLGNGWTAIMNFAFIPVYIRFIGIESYGLIGIYSSLLAIFSLLDIGLSATVNRELARINARATDSHNSADLVRTLEVIYWAIGVLIIAIIPAAAEAIAYQWVTGISLSPLQIQRAVFIMGVLISVQWPLSFYQGGLMGLEDQVHMQKISASFATLRFGGGAAALWLISPDIGTFFYWQIVSAAFEVITIRRALWKKIPLDNRKPKFRLSLTENLWRFAAGIGGISVMSTILTNTDKIILSKIVSLETFGYYSLSFSVAAVVYRVTTPTYSVFFSRFSRLVVESTKKDFTSQYHLACQIVAVTVLPLSLFIASYSKELMLLWTGNESVVENTHRLVSVLVIGTLLDCLMFIPYAVELAHGWTKFTLYKNLVTIIISIPLTVIMVQRYQAMGAAITWTILHAIYFLVEPQVVHKRFLSSKPMRFYLNNVGLPLLISVTIFGISVLWSQIGILNMDRVINLIAVLGLAVLASFFTSPALKKWLFPTK